MKIKTSWSDRLLAIIAMAILCGLAIPHIETNAIFVGAIVLLMLATLLLIYRFDYLHPSVAYVLPWLTIVAFSMIPISERARPLATGTYALVLGVIVIWMVSTVGAPVMGLWSDKSRENNVAPAPPFRNIKGLTAGFIVFYVLAALNIGVSGFIPILELLTAGDSRYADFGIPSVYGFFFAYANAIGCLAFYSYLRTKKRRYLVFFLSVAAIHLAFVTRQHFLTLAIESFVIRCLTIGRIGRMRLALFFLLGLVVLNFLGELRSGDIRDIIHIGDDYRWLPGAAAWLYAYSYFNVLNLENTIVASNAPYFDGTMLQTLLPSFLRPEVIHDPILDLPALNVSSYIFPVYLDIGIFGVLAFTAGVGMITTRVYRRALFRRRFGDIATYSCLFYCAILSFFSDIWLYLPVLFQIVFFWIFDGVFFGRTQKESAVGESRGGDELRNGNLTKEVT